MFKRLLLATILVVVPATEAGATAITIFNTGACAGNNAGGTCSGAVLVTGPSQFDNNYKLIARGDAGVTGNNSTQTTPPVGGSPGWVAQNTTSDWITPVPGGNFAAPNTYTYQTSFSLAGFVANTLVLSISIAAENLVAVRVNGGSTNVFTPVCNSGPPSTQPFCFQQFFSTTINNAVVVTANGSGWNAGTNTLEFIVTNNDNPSPTGLRVEVSGSATAAPVNSPPTISKSFGAASIPLNGTTSLTFTINNPNATTALTGVGFTDNLPAGLVVSTPNGLSGSCGGGTITAVAGSGTVSLAGATLPQSSSCTFAVNVTGTAGGTQNNTTGNVTSTQGGNGGTASASVTVCTAPLITCPGGITKFADSGQLGATVNPGTPVTSGGCSPVTITGVRSDGKALNALYPIGVTIITWTATDASGATATCGQSIAVMVPSGERRRPEEDEALLMLTDLLIACVSAFW